jgi:hypothetical protein
MKDSGSPDVDIIVLSSGSPVLLVLGILSLWDYGAYGYGKIAQRALTGREILNT